MLKVYIDDIIFGSTNEDLYEDFTKLMQGEFEICMMNELTSSLKLQIKTNRKGDPHWPTLVHKKTLIEDWHEEGMSITPSCRIWKGWAM